MSITALLIFLIALSFVSLLILNAFGILAYDADGIYLNADVFDDFLTSWYGWLIIVLMQVGITTLLCFVPGASMAFILLLQSLYAESWRAFLVAFVGVMLSSMIMYLTGRLGGYKLCSRILGKDEANKASELLNHKGVIFFPIMMTFPIFPDDALIMIAGTLKMSLKWFIPSIVFGRGVGIAAIIFGLGIVPYDKFTSPWHWILFIAICVILIVLVFYLAYKFNKFLQKRKK